MCTILVLPGGVEVGSPRWMAAQGWPVTDADVDDGYDLSEFWDACLCCVDVRGILDRHGVAYHDDGSGYIDVMPEAKP